ncbi:hypothetical protein HPP92_015592 [Vanilla planifolia]|uniref:DUF7356 domain-containing protein n=1 Tax=Vanilla planifolia TaxID=51239 RepID=A0A835QI67_VANPL|nr:hypothetical protein HPP92_015592 [Vanilla planifolia]
MGALGSDSGLFKGEQDRRVLSKASSESKLRDLVEEEKKDGKSDERLKAVPSSPFLPPPTVKSPATGQTQSSPPISFNSPPNSRNSDSRSPKSPPLSDNSAKLEPPTDKKDLLTPKQQQDNAIQSPPKTDDHKAQGAPEKGNDKPPQSPQIDTEVEKAKVPVKAPEKEEERAPQPLKDGIGSKGNEVKPKTGNLSDKNCSSMDTSNSLCHIGALVACLSQSGTKSVESFFLVENTGTDDLKVSLTVPNNIEVNLKNLILTKHSFQEVRFKTNSSKSLKIILNVGEGDCVLQTRATISDSLPIPLFPTYALQVRPVHGLFVLFATIVLAGGTWACCKLRKQRRKVDAGIPYQQLEMATNAQSASLAVGASPADRWDQSWDDDWDDEEAVRPSVKLPTGNVSSNGLSSRSGSHSKDGWEIDWDD